MASNAAAFNETDSNDAGNIADPRDERIKELEEQVRALKLKYEPEPEPEPEPDKIVGYYTMERKKNEDGTPKKVPLRKGSKDGVYYVNDAGNKVYGTPSSRHVEMLNNEE